MHPHLPAAYVRRIRVKRFLVAFYRDNVLFLASALSFDALLAAIPLALLFLVFLGADDLRTVLDLILPQRSADPTAPLATAERIINAVVRSRREVSLYAVPLFVLFSTRLFTSTRIVLDTIRAVQTRRRFLHDLGFDLILVVGTTVLLAANSYVSLPGLGLTPLDQLAGHLMAIGFGTALFFLVYFAAPTQRPQWATALAAAVLVAVVFELFKVMFGLYLVQYVTIYQAISHTNAIALILFVVWIYVTAVLFLLGGELIKAVEEHREGIVHEPEPIRRPDTASA